MDKFIVDAPLPLPLAERTLRVYGQASDEGWGGSDCTKLPAYWSGRKS
jgi:3-hydroxyisobutyrate dehydrogenase